MLRIGLTGGIASGKSTVANMFAELGVPVIDTDEIAHELVAPGGAALAAVTKAFGEDVLTDDGALDRKLMRRVVFADSDKRRKLEGILHPLIRSVALERAADSDGPYVLFVVPLLFETGFDALVDRTVTVDCPEAVQIERLIARDGISRDEALKIISAQIGRAERRNRADDIIDTSGELEATRREVDELHSRYRELAQNCSGGQGHAE